MGLDTKVGRMFGVSGTNSLQELEKLLKEYLKDGIISENIIIPTISRNGYHTQKKLVQEKD